MRYIKIKNTVLKASIICLGVANIGVKITEKDSYRLLDEYIKEGGNFIDTARVYSNWEPGEKNRSERILGEWLKSKKNREKIVLATKGGHPRLDNMENPRLSKKEVNEDLNGSLETLQTDYIDLYYLHRDDPQKPIEEIMDMLHDFEKSGKIRYYGCSNWSPQRIKNAQEYAKEKNYQGFVANSMLWNIGVYNMKKLADPTLVCFSKDMYDLHKNYDITAIPYSSQSKGFFAKLNSDKKRDKEKTKKSNYNTAENLNIYKNLLKITEKLDMSITEIVLSYLISQDIDTIPIVGCRTIEQLKDSLKAVNKKIPQEILHKLDKTAGFSYNSTN